MSAGYSFAFQAWRVEYKTQKKYPRYRCNGGFDLGLESARMKIVELVAKRLPQWIIVKSVPGLRLLISD